MPILFDVESRSRADLRRVGGRIYWEHPASEVLCVAWYDTRTARIDVWTPGDAAPDWRDRDVAAHNAMGFDRFAIARLGWPVRSWIDTSELARRAGLPGALEELGERVAGVPKDVIASRFTRGLSSVRRPREITPDAWRALSPAAKRERGRLPDVDAEALARVVRYCISDVEIMARAWPVLEPWLGVDADVAEVERAINDRGVAFDARLARALLRSDEAHSRRVLAEVACELGATAAEVAAAARSPAQFCAATGAADARKGTVALLDHPLVRARQALSSIARGKLEAGLARVSLDGRMRDTHRYYGAHTGRWSGRGMQLQNLPRPARALEDLGDDAICALADRVVGGYDATPDEVALLLRATLTASPGHRLVVCDFSGVEARALAWMARDADALEVFAAPGADPYCEMASVIFGVPAAEIGKGTRRTVGKIAELACGYGMGATKFGATAAAAGVDLGEAGVDAAAVVAAWRGRHAPIVRFWRALESAFGAAMVSGYAEVDAPAPLRYVASATDADVALILPSGRPVVYPDARYADRDGRPSLAYRGARGVEHTYGGKLAENAIQALCRDLLADALMRAERAGLCPVMHVHDEIVCDVPEERADAAYEQLRTIMTTPPAWAAGFPAGAAGYVARRYRK